MPSDGPASLPREIALPNGRPTVIVITGPTASGKSALAVEVARALGCEVVSADSRQIYRGIPIGTAQPTEAQMGGVRHHLIGFQPLEAYYSAARWVQDAMALLPALTRRDGAAVVVGGSMMYVDALVRGLDPLPTVSEGVRHRVAAFMAAHTLEEAAAWLSMLDPGYETYCDTANPRRVAHAIEICLEAGKPYSSLRTGGGRKAGGTDLPFDVVQYAIARPREQLFSRINARVDAMVDAGMVEEARGVYHLRHLNSLNTVGYKELFAAFDGQMDLPTAIARIAKDTRVYAKKQLTWLDRCPDVIPIPL